MTRRRLAPEELELWKKATERTERMHQRRSFDPDAYAVPAKPKPSTPLAMPTADGKTPPRPPARKVEFDLVSPVADRLRKAPVQMDKKTFAKMARGKLKPDARIDLHGMTLDRAHGVLNRFIFDAHASGKRLVLVITGKGKDRDEGGPIPVRYGVLRHQVPHWLSIPPLASVVMQVNPAHLRHGGGGAYYVYLKRPK